MAWRVEKQAVTNENPVVDSVFIDPEQQVMMRTSLYYYYYYLINNRSNSINIGGSERGLKLQWAVQQSYGY